MKTNGELMYEAMIFRAKVSLWAKIIIFILIVVALIKYIF